MAKSPTKCRRRLGVPVSLALLHVIDFKSVNLQYNTVERRTEVRFASFFSIRFINAIVVNLLERRLAKRTSVRRIDGTIVAPQIVD